MAICTASSHVLVTVSGRLARVLNEYVLPITRFSITTSPTEQRNPPAAACPARHSAASRAKAGTRSTECLGCTSYPADAVSVTVMFCWVVTAVDVGALKRTHRLRVPEAGTDRPVWPPAYLLAEHVAGVAERA